MLKYLKNLPRLRTSADLVVLGNQSADMDSCCSALVAAFLHTETSKVQAIPLIQIPRKDFRLRRDIVFLFQQLGIETEWLFFLDDLEINAETKLFLVDHNSPTVSGKVVGIIDHHEVENDNADFSKCDPLRIVKCGSCISAIINHFSRLDSVEGLFQKDPLLAPLALSPILQDTNNMTKKIEQDDIDAIKFLKSYANFSTFSPFENFSVLNSAKKDLTDFTGVDLLRKDYKQWGAVGISSLPKLFKKLSKLNYDLGTALIEFKEQNHLDIMIALANGTTGEERTYVRQLAVCGPPDFDIAKQCPTLELEILSTSPGGVKFYNQRNTAASRKQVAPVVRKAFADHA